MFIAGTNDQRLLYLDHRLGNRRTFCNFDNQLMGPILDTRGLEQGGVSSSDQYKLYNNEQAAAAQLSNLGVPIRDDTISYVSLADDAVLLSNNIFNLKHLLFLTTQYCHKYKVKLVPEKTKLMVFSKDNDVTLVQYPKLVSSISLYNENIDFSEQAEHLGIIRSSNADNMVNILERLSAYKKKLFSVLPAGLALHHHAPPAACFQVEQLYALPVLLSGISALVLSKYEANMVYSFHKNMLSKLMKLHDRTPDPVIFFLSGSLPVTAHLHLRQLSLLNMISHLGGNILKNLAMSILVEAKPSAKSWFQEVRSICIQYELPHPIYLLQNPIPKEKFKKLSKLKVFEFWHQKLSKEGRPPLSPIPPSWLPLPYQHSPHLCLP